jgi:hypothetical protein
MDGFFEEEVALYWRNVSAQTLRAPLVLGVLTVEFLWPTQVQEMF